MRIKARPGEPIKAGRAGTDVRAPHPKGTWDAIESRNGIPWLVPYQYRQGEEERQQWVLEQIRKAQEIAQEKHPNCRGRWE